MQAAVANLTEYDANAAAQVSWRAVMPGAGFFEMAAAAAASLLPAPELDSLTLADVTIPAPLVLQSGPSLFAEAVLDCTSGAVEIASLASSHRQVHCRAKLCSVDPGKTICNHTI